MAALSESVLAVNMLLSVLFLPGVLAHCGTKTPALNITAPNNIRALSGSCLEIPCSFNTVNPNYDSKKTINGVWMKDSLHFSSVPNVVIFNSSGSVNTFSLNIIGNLTEKNCTTLFPDLNTSFTDKYFFRVENGNYRATACADPVKIAVKDSPWSPSINIPVDLKEHQSVTISCSALTPCPHSPPELTWNLQQDSHRQTEKNTEGTFTKIQETITLSDTHDGYNISCSATYPVNGGNKTAEIEVTLSVSYAPKDTSASISPSGLVSAGSWVELSCSSRAKPPASFTWFRNSKHGAINVSVGQVYSFNATEGREYYCEATNDLGHQRSSLILLINKDPTDSVYRDAILVGSIVLISLIVVCVWCLRSKCPTLQQTQIQTEEDAAVQIPANEREEELQYSEVNFLQRRPEASSGSGKDRGQQEMVYSQVKMSADTTDYLYAEVNKT